MQMIINKSNLENVQAKNTWCMVPPLCTTSGAVRKKGESFLKMTMLYNYMITRCFLCCNNSCDVCGNKNQININRDRHNDTETRIYTDGIIDIFTAGKIISARKFRQTLTKMLGN
jgi:hypothetical protein